MAGPGGEVMAEDPKVKCDYSLPTPFKFCEGCKHFVALTRDNIIHCGVLGLVNGVVFCRLKKEDKGEADEWFCS